MQVRTGLIPKLIGGVDVLCCCADSLCYSDSVRMPGREVAAVLVTVGWTQATKMDLELIA